MMPMGIFFPVPYRIALSIAMPMARPSIVMISAASATLSASSSIALQTAT